MALAEARTKDRKAGIRICSFALGFKAYFYFSAIGA